MSEVWTAMDRKSGNASSAKPTGAQGRAIRLIQNFDESLKLTRELEHRSATNLVEIKSRLIAMRNIIAELFELTTRK